jgi:hypothetical protein
VNLKDGVGQVYGLINYNPQLAAYRDIVATRMAALYGQVNGEAKWLFLQREVAFPVYADVVGSASITSAWTNGSITVTVNGVAGGTHWRGQTIAAPDGTWYAIAEVTLTSSTQTTIYLATIETFEPAAYAGSTVASSADFSIRFDRYALPHDCLEPLGWKDDEDPRRSIPFIDRRRAEELLLDRDLAGDVDYFIEDDHVQDRAPDLPFTLTVSSGGSLAGIVEYEYGYTFTYCGRESAMSMTVRATTTNANKTIAIAGMEDTQVSAALTGRWKNLYRRDVTNNGRWLRLATGLADSATTFTDDNSPAPSNLESLVYYPQGPRQYVRPYFKAGADDTLRLRYTFTPRPLAADADVPVWPPIYHALLVYRTIEEIAMQANQTALATVYTRKAAALDGQMKNDKRCIERSNRDRVRRAGFGDRGGYPSARYGRIDFDG